MQPLYEFAAGSLDPPPTWLAVLLQVLRVDLAPKDDLLGFHLKSTKKLPETTWPRMLHPITAQETLQMKTMRLHSKSLPPMRPRDKAPIAPEFRETPLRKGHLAPIE